MTILNRNQLIAHFTTIGIHVFGDECLEIVTDEQAEALADNIMLEFNKFHPTCDHTSKESQLKSIRNYFNSLLKIFQFKITLLDCITDRKYLVDDLFDAGCGDSLVCWENKVPYIEFTRQARSIDSAIHVALEQLRSIDLKHFSISYEVKYETV